MPMPVILYRQGTPQVKLPKANGNGRVRLSTVTEQLKPFYFRGLDTLDFCYKAKTNSIIIVRNTTLNVPV